MSLPHFPPNDVLRLFWALDITPTLQKFLQLKRPMLNKQEAVLC